jgi:hypothetical protein
MKQIVIVMALPALVAAVVLAQPESPASSPTTTGSEVQELREAVRSLSETVKQLQQQVKDQQAALDKANITSTPALPQNGGTRAVASQAETKNEDQGPDSAGPSSLPSKTPPQLIPTEDSSVIASSGPTPASATGNTSAIPTEDSSVVRSTSSPETISSTGTGASLVQPLGISGNGGKNYMNISLDAMFALAGSSARDIDRVEVGDHDPQQRGFNARNIELAFDGAVDPYFQGFANIVFKLDNDNNTEVEAEEAFAQTTNLPFNLQLKAGQFFDAFGRINPTHPHVWDFADAPIVVGRLLGPDGLRGVGTQLSWVLPVPWYAQLSLGVQNGRGATAYSFRNPGDNGMFFARETNDRELRGLGDFLWQPRFETSVDLSSTQVVLAGVSGAFAPNDTGAHTRTQIYGGDFLYKWKSEHAEGGFPFVKWQTEVMYRRFEAGRGVDDMFPVAETFHDWGLYSQVLWGFKKGWVAGIRGDYYDAQDSRLTDDLDRQSRSRVTANLTWYPTEFSKIRLQYEHDFMDDTFFLAGRDVDSVFLQFEFILGAHGAHKF